MFIYDTSFSSFQHFLNGYFTALQAHLAIDISQEIQEWLWKKEGKHFSLQWMQYILLEKAEED